MDQERIQMDSKCQQEDSTNSSGEESDQVHLQNSAISRSYECVFCKRGFTTAQALGGHMNIHRKDKAKTTPSKEDKQQQNSYGCKVPTIFPVSTSLCTHNHSHQNLLRGIEDYQVGLSLSLKFGTSKFGEDMEINRRGGLIDDDLDLELRLGHNP